MRFSLPMGLGFAMAFVVAAVLSSAAHACPNCCQPCVTYTTVEKTIMVPTTVYQKRIVHCTEYRPEERECTVNVTRQIPETKQVTKVCTVLVPKAKVRQEYYTVCKPVYTKKQYEITVMVPKPVVKQGVRQVCRYEPTEVTNTVCEDHGCWVTDECGNCCWQPNIVEKQVTCTVMKPVTYDEPYEYTVMECEPQKRMVEKTVCHYEYEKKVRDVHYTVCEAKKVEKVYNVTSYRCVTEPQVRKYTAMVPHQVEKEITVPVCEMVPKTVVCQVPVYGCGK